MRIYYQLLLVIILSFPVLAGISTAWCEENINANEKPPVWGTDYNGGVLIGWRPNLWAQEQTGYKVLRKKSGQTKFTLLTPQGISPDITLSHAQELGLKDAAKRISEGTVNEIPSAVLLKIYKDFGVKEYVSLRENDLQMLQLSGFGWVDYSTQSGVQYIYQVTPVLNGRDAAPLGEITITAGQGKPEVKLEYFTGSRTADSRVDLEWCVDQFTQQKFGITGFKVFASAPEDAVTELDPVMVTPASKQDELFKVKYAYHDLKNNSPKSRKYALQPVFSGNREGEFSKRIIIHGVKNKLPDPILKLSEFAKNNVVQIAWDFPAGQSFAGFNVYRTNEKDSKLAKINEQPLPVNARTFIDPTPPEKPESVFRYQIEALSGDYRLNTVSHEALPLRTPYPVPTPPLNLQAIRITSDGGAAYKLTWDKPKIPGYEYRLKQLVGDRWINAQPPTTKFKLIIPVEDARDGEKLTFAMTSLTKDGVNSELSEPIELIAYSGDGMKAVSSLTAISLPAAARISWRYFSPDSLKGFRIYISDKLALDEKRLTPLVRQAYIPGLTPEKKYSLRVIPVSIKGKEGSAASIEVTAKEVKLQSLPEQNLDMSLLKNPQVKHQIIYFGDTPKSGIAVEYDYVQDKKGHKWFHGTKKAYNPDGTLFSEHHYYAGKMHGKQSWFGPEGKLLREITYDHGKPINSQETLP